MSDAGLHSVAHVFWTGLPVCHYCYILHLLILSFCQWWNRLRIPSSLLQTHLVLCYCELVRAIVTPDFNISDPSIFVCITGFFLRPGKVCLGIHTISEIFYFSIFRILWFDCMLVIAKLMFRLVISHIRLHISALSVRLILSISSHSSLSHSIFQPKSISNFFVLCTICCTIPWYCLLPHSHNIENHVCLQLLLPFLVFCRL